MNKSKVLLLAHHALGDLIMLSPVINYLNDTNSNYELFITVRDSNLKSFCINYFRICEKKIFIINSHDLLKSLITLLKIRFCRIENMITPGNFNHKKSYILQKLTGINLNFNHIDLSVHKTEESFENIKALTNNKNLCAKDYYKLPYLTPINRDKIIVLHPGSGPKERFKQYPMESWVQVITYILEKHPNFQLIITGHGSEEIRTCFNIEKSIRSNNFINLAGKLNLDELISLINSSSLFISADCGPSHIASISNTPQITIFGPTDKNYTGALNTTSALFLTSPPSCSPCYGTKEFGTKGCSNNVCMKDIPPNDINSEVDKVLKL